MNAAFLALMSTILNEAAKEESRKTQTEKGGFYSPTIEAWIFEEPLETKYEESDFGSIRNYIDEMLCNQNGRTGCISIDGYPDFYKPRIWDINEYQIYNKTSSSLKAVIKFWKKQHFMDAIVRRLLRVEYALHVYEAIRKNPKLLVRFMKMSLLDDKWNQKLQFDYWNESFRKALYIPHKKTSEFFPWQIEIVPYIRKNLIECMELMGVSFYDWIYDRTSAFTYLRYSGDYSLQFLPMKGFVRMYDVIYKRFKEALKMLTPSKLVFPDVEYVKQQLTDLKYEPNEPDVRQWCVVRPTSMHRDIWNSLLRINTFHPIMTLDYMWACTNEIGYIVEHRNEHYPFTTNGNQPLRPVMLEMIKEELDNSLCLLRDYQFLETHSANEFGNALTWKWYLFFVNVEMDPRHVVSSQYYKNIPEEKKRIIEYTKNINYHMFDDLEFQMKKIGSIIRGEHKEEDY